MEASEKIYTRNRLSVIWDDIKFIFYINIHRNDSAFVINLKKCYNKILTGEE